MDLMKRVQINMADVRSFGLLFLLRHISRVVGHSTTLVNIPGFGRMHIRIDGSDLDTVRQVFQKREYELNSERVTERINRRYSEILSAGKVPVIADAGANIGSATLWFKTRYPNSFVVAIEPEPGNLGVLRRNAERREGVAVLGAAIGAEPGFVSIENHDMGWAARTLRADEGIPIVRMKDVFDSVPNGCPFIAKIDIEGFESDLFSSNCEWIDDVFVIFIEPHDWMLPGLKTSRTFQQALSRHDFEIFVCGENLCYVRT